MKLSCKTVEHGIVRWMIDDFLMWWASSLQSIVRHDRQLDVVSAPLIDGLLWMAIGDHDVQGLFTLGSDTVVTLLQDVERFLVIGCDNCNAWFDFFHHGSHEGDRRSARSNRLS